MQEDTPRPPSGALPTAVIKPMAARVSPEVIKRFLALEDLSGTVSDVLDTLGAQAVVGASVLIPTIQTARVVGTAVTVRNVTRDTEPGQSMVSNDNLMTEIEGINQGDPGDVLVIQGVRHVSNMGGIMATLAHRQGLAGAIVDGGVRDVAQSRQIGFPVWSRDISPVTGKWRCETVEVNGPVVVGGCVVRPGDLVVADETGTCFVPQRLVEKVLELAEAVTEKERAILRQLGGDMSVQELSRALYRQRA